MRHIVIGFSRNKHNAVFSVLLQKYMKKKYSHVYLKYNTKAHLGDDAIYHSSLSGGVSYMSETKFLENNEEIYLYKIEVTDEMYNTIKFNLFRECGDSYGIWQNMGILVVDFIRSLGINVKNPFTKGQNCSELIYREIIQKIFPEYPVKYDPQTVRPDHIEKILNSEGIEKLI